jgi:hypothetical protein
MGRREMNHQDTYEDDRQNGGVVGWLFLALFGILPICLIMILIGLTTA